MYVLKLSSNKHYIGITKNLVKRLQQHNNKQGGFTSNFGIVSLIYLDYASSYQLARKKELKIKSIGARKYMLQCKFSDRFYIDVPIINIVSLSNKVKPLKQLKIINNQKQYL